LTSHPFVVQLHSAFQTRQHLYLVMDYCAGGDLGLHIRSGPYGRLPEPAACFVCAELLLAIEALHDAGVIHRDIKAENVLIDALGHVKIADLNAAKRDERLTSGGRTYTVVGTPFAAAPEVLRGEGVSERSDIYSLGLVLNELFTGVPVYRPSSISELEAMHDAPLPAPSTIGAARAEAAITFTASRRVSLVSIPEAYQTPTLRTIRPCPSTPAELRSSTTAPPRRIDG
jgi:serine/threonine protein kinase